jgi:UDP-3-O-[3-hydroxymyristoyl] N-acetylglucosamine deacetylase/3-hydroxyacyl-[acyl-carrier-protein] dehydratase
VYTTEHILAALYGCQVDNALIKIDAPEVPIMDGSSLPFVKAIEEVGYEEQLAVREYLILDEIIPWEDTDKGIEFLAVPDPNYRITVMVDYKSPVLGTQHASMYNIDEFKEHFAACRTFVFLRELEFLATNNLIKGGDLDNAIVLVERTDVSQEELNRLAKLLGKEDLKISIDGIGVLNSTKLQFENEPARHKLLDIVGDLALVGKPIKAHILGARPGHSGNVRFAKVLKEQIKKQEKAGRKFDLTKDPLYTTCDIEKLLPHRYPFLMVDKIMEINEESIIGVKNITMNEPIFTGHFPGNPVFPGVLQIEAMAQVGGIFALSKVEDPQLYSTYFMKIDKVKFKQKVVPGDTVVFELSLLSPIRRGLVEMIGRAFVNGKLVAEAEMLAQIIKDK